MQYFSGVAAMLLVLGTSQANAQATPQICGGTFAAMNFAFRNYDAYDEYFHNDSIMELAQAGVYTGPAAIAEYVKFANPENPAIEERTTLNQTFTLMGIEADVCEFYSNAKTFYAFNELFSNGTLNVTNAFRMYLNVTSGKFDRINVFYDTEYLLWFAGMSSFPGPQAWVCNAMETSCSSTWSYNNLTSQADCVSQLSALPATTGDYASYDGDSQACRALHATLAELNPSKHCAHISFAPQEDPSGAVKCQTSKNVQGGDLFTPAHMALLATFKAENNMPASGYIAVIPCETDNALCPNSQVCVENVCGEPVDMVPENHTNTSGNSSMNDTDDNSTDSSDNSSTTTDETESSAAYSMQICTGILLVLAAVVSTPF